MCDPPVCEHRFRSCHTVYFILSMDDIGYWITPPFVEPVTLRQLSMADTLLVPANIRATTTRYRKFVAHRLHCAMPLSGNFAIQAPPILVKLAFSLRRHFFQRGSTPAPSYIPRYMENSARKLSEECWRLSNENPSPKARHGSSVDAAGGVTNLTVTGDGRHA